MRDAFYIACMCLTALIEGTTQKLVQSSNLRNRNELDTLVQNGEGGCAIDSWPDRKKTLLHLSAYTANKLHSNIKFKSRWQNIRL